MSHFNALFSRFADLKVLVIGDVMIDSYIWGRAERISPEAPIPIVTKTKQESRLGGAANVALNIRSLGATAILCTVIGEDAKGKIFRQRMKFQGLTEEAIRSSEQRRTTEKTRIISQGQHLLRVDEEDTAPLEKELEKELIQTIGRIIEQGIDAIVFEDYDKGVITPKIIETCLQLAGEKQIPVLVDPKKRNFEAYTGVTVFKPNFKELQEGLHIELQKTNTKEVFRAARSLREKQKAEWVLVTLSEEGVLMVGEKEWHHLPAEKRDISDVSGAGDTLIATASLCLAAGCSPKELAYISNMAGGLVCEKVGVVPINKAGLLAELQHSGADHS